MCRFEPQVPGPSTLTVVALLAGLVLLVGVVVPVAAQGPRTIEELEALQAEAEGSERVAVLAELAGALKDVDPERGLSVAEEAVALAGELGDGTGAARAHLARGENLNILGRNDEAFDAYRAALTDYERNADAVGQAATLRRIGVSYYDLGELERALESYLASLEIAEAAGADEEIAKSSANLGNVYWATGRAEEAMRYQERALAAFEASGNRLGVAGTSINLASVHSAMASSAREAGDEAAFRRLLDRTVEGNRRALGIFEELGIGRGVATALSNLASAHERLGELEEALDAFERYLELRRAVDDRVGVVNSLHHIGTLHADLGNLDRAEEVLLEARALGEEIGARMELARVLSALATVYEARGEWRRAFEQAVEAREVEREIARDEAEARIDELEARYRSEQRAREIELLTREGEIARLEAERQRTFTRGSALVAALAALLLTMVWSRYRGNVRASEKLEEVARTDTLTGIPNRRAMLEGLEREAARARRTGEPFALLLIDVDDFKGINDALGHDVGDRALVTIAAAMSRRLRGTDLLGRWGGEEFLALLPSTGLDQAVRLGDELRGSLASRSFVFGGRSVRLTVTIGAATCDGHEGIEACLRQADHALLEGKRAGKNRVLSLSA